MPGTLSRHVQVETTVGDEATARRLARDAVAKRLAACANIVRVHSVYRWKGAIEAADEFLVSFKTTRSRQAALTHRISTLHPYEVPFIGVGPLGGLARRYASWLEAETRPPRQKKAGTRPRQARR